MKFKYAVKKAVDLLAAVVIGFGLIAVVGFWSRVMVWSFCLGYGC